MSDQNKSSLLVVTTERDLSKEWIERFREQITPVCDELGLKAMVMDGGLSAGIHSDIAPLIRQQIEEQRKTNQLLLALIEAMAEDDTDMGDGPSVYMDGSKVSDEY